MQNLLNTVKAACVQVQNLLPSESLCGDAKLRESRKPCTYADTVPMLKWCNHRNGKCSIKKTANNRQCVETIERENLVEQENLPKQEGPGAVMSGV